MTIFEPGVKEVPAQHHPDDDDLIHIVCCEDENIALCGTRWEDGETNWVDDEEDCIVCRDLQFTSFCPKFGVDHCEPL